MIRSRILTVSAIAATLFAAGCNKKPKVEGEVRVPGGNFAVSDAVDTTNEKLGGPAAGWSPTDGPPPLDGNGGVASTPAASPFTADSGTGGIVQDADLSGVEAASQIADLDMVHFDYDQAGIRPEWETVLTNHAEWMKAHPSLHVQIEGHCDERGTEEYNVTLGQRRADSVREFLVNKGVEGYRLSTISYGKLRPLTFDQSEEAHSLNRRAMFLVYTPGTETASAY
ncbi:MAG: peptidoglycan-associated lipoprotein [Candidatus Sumerlaeota bacterium]|nr:peptidoglycan-associated lipoprotein [Candidatus Sumerlaeota bacterium]